MKYAIMFLITILVDVVWAKWASHTAAGNAALAACYSVGIVLGGALSVIWYLADYWMLIPICAGSFIGTYVAVWHSETGGEK